ncbi:MAG: OmpH family outer membrane protein [Parerythrobacter sp.]
MTKFLTLALSASTMALGLAAAPVSAQVNGIATASPEAVVVQSQARAAAYQAINTQYAAQLQQATTLNTEMATLRASLDTDGDQQVSEAEVAANPAVIQQMQQKQQQSDTVLQPLRLAQVYVIDQLTQNYEAARNQVLSTKGIQMLLTPEAIQYAPDGINVTSDILAAFNQRTPNVPSTPPAEYQPTAQAVQNFQQIQQIIGALVQRQALQQQAQQQQATPAPSGR